MSLQVWGDYEVDLDQVLGRGGMGTVYRGRQLSLDRPVAVKVLRKELTDDPAFVRRFRREAGLLAKLVDSHVVQVYGAGEVDGRYFYAMEYVDGKDLAGLMKPGQVFEEARILEIAEAVGLALRAAWKLRIVHRDIKPSNILITRDGGIKVMDFGLAKNVEQDLTRSRVIMGTAKYISPEQGVGDPCDFRSDLYSFGVMAYEMAVGKPPFTADNPTALIYQHVHKDPDPPKNLNPGLSSGLQALILRCLAKNPDRRYQDPDEFLRDVRALQQGRPVGSRTLDLPATSPTLTRRPAGAVPPPSEPTSPTVAAGGGQRSPTETAPLKRSAASTVAKFAFALSLLAAAAFLYIRRPWDRPGPVPENGANRKTDGGRALGGSENLNHVSPPRPDGPAPEERRRAFNEAMAAGEYGRALELAEKHFGRTTPEYTRAEYAFRTGDALKRAQDDYDTRRWADAKGKYEEALRLLKPDDPRRSRVLVRIDACRYRLAMQKEAYEEALRLAGKVFGESSEEYREAERRRREALCAALEREARGKEDRQDWQGAADAYRKALAYAPDDRQAGIRAALEFCRDLAEGLRAEAEGDWAEALQIYRRRLAAPRAHVQYLRKAVDRAEAGYARIVRERRNRILLEAESLLRSARKAVQRARWADAMAGLEKAKARLGTIGGTNPEVDALLKELEPARNVPDGYVYVPPGTFQMGTDEGRLYEGPRHEVRTGGFYIMVREVTRAEYARFLASPGAESHRFCHRDEPKGKTHTPKGWSPEPADGPVTGVDWFDAFAYAHWAGARLPTEAEWEKAAAFDLEKGISRKYPWGGKYTKDAEDLSFLGCRGMATRPLEWTASDFDRYPGSKADHVPAGKRWKVLRGGPVLDEMAETQCRTTHRYWQAPERRRSDFGIRCVKDVK